MVKYFIDLVPRKTHLRQRLNLMFNHANTQDIQRSFQHLLHRFQHLTPNRISANAYNKGKKNHFHKSKPTSHTTTNTHTLKITSLKLFTNPFLSRCIPGHHHPARHEVPLLLLTRIPRSPNHHQTILNWCKT